MTYIITDRFVMEAHLRAKGGQAHSLTHQGVVIGDVLEPIVVTVQSQTNHSQNQNVP